MASPLVFADFIVVATVDPTWGVLTWLLPINGVPNSRLVESHESDRSGSAT